MASNEEVIKSNLHLMAKLTTIEVELENTQETLMRIFSRPNQVQSNVDTIKGNFAKFREFNDQMDKLIDNLELSVENTASFIDLLKGKTKPHTPSEDELQEGFNDFLDELDKKCIKRRQGSLYRVGVVGFPNKRRFEEEYGKFKTNGHYVDEENLTEYIYLSPNCIIDGIRLNEVINKGESPVNPDWYRNYVEKRMAKEKSNEKSGS